MKKSKYYENYEKRTSLSSNGKSVKEEYIYIGDYFKVENGKKKVSLAKAQMLVIAILSLFIYISLGFLDNAGSRLFYVILPYVIAFLPIAFMVIAAVRFAIKRDNYTVFDYNKIWIRLKNTCMANMVLLCFSIVGDLIFLILHFENVSKSKELCFFFGCSFLAVLSCSVYKIQKQLKCIRMKNFDIH